MERALDRPHKSYRLSTRVVLASSVIVLLAVIAIGSLIRGLHSHSVERAFEELLSVHKFNLIGDVRLTSGGQLTGIPRLGDDRYDRPNTGWSWRVTPAAGGVTGQLASRFLPADLQLPDADTVPFNAEFERRFDARLSHGALVRVIEQEVVLGSEDQIALFTVIAGTSELQAEKSAFGVRVFTALAALAAILVAINAVAIIRGLRPLSRARDELNDVQLGRADHLSTNYPDEIRTLVLEVNQLLDNNRQTVERARKQVGDLAHSLKTPLAVVTNEANSSRTPDTGLIAEQADAIRVQIDRYLQKARIAAQTGSLTFRCDLHAIIERMVRVFTKLNPGMTIEKTFATPSILVAAEEQDVEEMLGNLMENASKWGRTAIRVGVEDAVSDDGFIRVIVEDDGPGIADSDLGRALDRGKRLDETTPGTGLGLSIVRDTVTAYGGDIVLSRSDLGGLRATLTLPKVQILK